MRNGDFAPSRLEAQQDAVNLLAGAKTQSNPENVVGVLTSAGPGVEVRVSMTTDVGKVLAQSHGAKVGGEANLSAGLQVAALALKHRQNKNQRQRVIVFVGSPIKEEESALVKLGKKLKKNSVAVDIVNFGEETENTPKLEALLNAVNSDDNSHLVTVPPGPHVLSDILITSPIVQDGDGGGGGGMPTGGGGDGGGLDGFPGVNADLDPELAYALRISMEEERQRQAELAAKEAAEGAAASGEGATAGADASSDAPMADAGAPPAEGDVDEAALLEAAIAMSNDGGASSGATPIVTPAAGGPVPTPAAPPPRGAVGATEPSPTVDAPMADAEEDEDEAMQLALAMSMSQGGGDAAGASAAPPAGGAAPNPEVAAMFQDPSFVQSVLGSLPGVDPNDPRIRSVIESMPKEGEEKKDEQGKK